jgi:hypothetical protein
MAAALAVSIALPAAASPAFDAFKKACGDSHADFAAIKAALAGHDWAPTEILPTNMEGVTPTEGVARTATIGNERVSIYAWEGLKGQFHLTACTARVAALPLAQANGEAKAWLGFAPESANGKSTWRYGLTNGAPAAVNMADKTAPQAAAAADGLFFLNVFTDHGEVVIDLLKIKS